jgi:hypothetical protein
MAFLEHSKKRSLAKHAHWLQAPKSGDVHKSIVESYYTLARSIGRFSLLGVGYELLPHKGITTEAFGEKRENLEARMWTEEDTMLSGMPQEHRDAILRTVFDEALKHKGVLDGKTKFEIRIDSPGTLPQYVREYAELAARRVVPEIVKFLQTLPEALRNRPEAFLNLEFYHHLADLHTYLISPNLIERFGHGDHDEDVKVLVPSLAYALSRVSDTNAADILGQRAAHRLYRRSKDSFIRRHKRASGLWQAIRKRFGKQNRFLLSEEDVTEFNVLNHAYRTTPETLEMMIRSARTLYQYHPEEGEEYASLAKNVIRNAHKLHVDTAILGAHGRSEDDAYDASDKLHREFMDRLAVFDESTGARATRLDTQSSRILRMLKSHEIAAENYRTAFIDPLTRPRQHGEHQPNKHNDHRTEGPLVRIGNYFEGTERLLNEPSQAGFFYHLADSYHERFYEYIERFNLAGVGTALGLTNRANIERWKEWLEGSGHHHAIVRPNTLGWVFTLAGTKLSWWAIRRGYYNIKDNDPFFSPTKAVRQIAGEVVRGRIGELIEDAFKESEIPDNPTRVSIGIPDLTDRAFHAMRPAYLRSRTHSGLLKRTTLALLPFADRALPLSMDDYHTLLNDRDFVADEDNIPTLAAIGMLNVRRNDLKYARKFLGMTSNWSKRAKQLHVPANNWDALAQYELSVMYGIHGDEEQREEHLLNAFDAFAQLSQVEVAPFSSSTDELERYCLLHPMNYAKRNEFLRKADNGYTGEEQQITAHHAYSEIATILSAKDITASTGKGRPLDAAVRWRLRQLKESFGSLIIDARYKVLDEDYGGRGMGTEDGRDLESRVEGQPARPGSPPLAPLPFKPAYVAPEYRLSNDPGLSEGARRYLVKIEGMPYERAENEGK